MNAAFALAFGIFVVLMLGLAFVAIRWGVRRDRDALVRRRREAEAEDDRPVQTRGDGESRERT